MFKSLVHQAQYLSEFLNQICSILNQHTFTRTAISFLPSWSFLYGMCSSSIKLCYYERGWNWKNKKIDVINLKQCLVGGCYGCVMQLGIYVWNKEYLAVVSSPVSRQAGRGLPSPPDACQHIHIYNQVLWPITHWEHWLPSFDPRKLYTRDGCHSETIRQC